MVMDPAAAFFQLPAALDASCAEAWRQFVSAPERSRELASQALAGATHARARGWAGVCLAHHLARAGQTDEAAALLSEARPLLRASDDRRGDDLARVVDGYVLIVRGKPELALPKLEEVAASQSASLGAAPLDRFLGCHALALAHMRVGQLERVMQCHYANVVMLERCNYVPALAVVLLNLSSTLGSVEDWEEAFATAIRALRCCETMDNPALRRRIEINVALANRFRGRIEDALELLARLREEPLRDPGSDFALFINSAEALAVHGEFAEASRCLERARRCASANPHELANCEWIAGLVAARSGDAQGAIEHLVRARDCVQGLKNVHIPILPRIVEQLAACYAQTGDHEQAFATYQRFHELYGARLGYTTRARDAGRRSRHDALSVGRPALEPGAPGGASDEIAQWARLNEALRRPLPIPGERHAGGAAPAETVDAPVKVFALGRFEVRVHGEPLRYGRKMPSRPLALLKYLAAQGEREPPESEVADALWPDQDGDVALGSLAVNLHRLRRLLGDAAAVVHRDRRIALDMLHVWSDVLELERLLDQAATAGDDEDRLRLTERALALYRGDFLAGDDDASWTLTVRDRLRGRLVSACAAQASLFAASGRMQEARAFYLRGLRIDDGVEELCLGAMRCSLAVGETAAGIAAYRALERSLASRGRSPPSAAIQALYAQLLGRQR